MEELLRRISALLQSLFSTDHEALSLHLKLYEPAVYAAIPSGLGIAALAKETANQLCRQRRLRAQFTRLGELHALRRDDIAEVERACRPLRVIEEYLEILHSRRDATAVPAGGEYDGTYAAASYVSLPVVAVDGAKYGAPPEIQLDELVYHSRFRHIVLLGGPGSGKSTALGRLHDRCLLEGGLAGLASFTVPVHVSLRGFVGDPLRWSVPGWIQQQLEARWGAGLPPDLTDALLGHIPLLLLVDGLDEVDPQLRAPLCQRLQRTLAEHTMVVTCRTAAYPRPGGYLGADDSTWRLGPLRRQQQDLFMVRRCSMAAREWIADALDAPLELGPRLRDMAGTPLFMAVLCATARVDQTAVRLSGAYYAACLAELVRRRPMPAALDCGLRPLHPLAHVTFPGSSWSRARWVDEIRRHLSPAQRAHAEDLVDWLIHGAGLLAERGPRVLELSPVGLHEHLAACHLVSAGDSAAEAVLHALGLGADWHEVVRLWAEEASAQARSTVVEDPAHGTTLLRLLWRHGVGVQESVLRAAARSSSHEVRGVASLIRDGIPPSPHGPMLVHSSAQEPNALALAARLAARGLRALANPLDPSMARGVLEARLDARVVRSANLAARRGETGSALVLWDGTGPAWDGEWSLLHDLVDAGWPIACIHTADDPSTWPADVPARHFDLEEDFDDLCRWLAVVPRCGRSFIEPTTGIRFRWGRDPALPLADAAADRFGWFAEQLVTNAQAARWGGFPRRGVAVDLAQGPDDPIVEVSWKEIQAFCGWLSTQPAIRSAGLVVQLPREAQWIAAVRAVGEIREWCLDLDDGMQFRVIRGGDLGQAGRELLPESMCAPNLGFRLMANLRAMH